VAKLPDQKPGFEWKFGFDWKPGFDNSNRFFSGIKLM
jgi:hypothetical protein